MIRARIALFIVGVCGLAPLAFGQEPVGELTQRIDQSPAYLNPLLVNQWVALSANRSIGGKLVAFNDAGELQARPVVEVSLVQKGKTVTRAITGAEGEFEFKNVGPGTYTFVAQSDYSFATFGLHVLPIGSGSPSSFDACVSTVSSGRAKDLIKENWVPSKASSMPKNFDKDPANSKRVVSSSPKVLLQNGDLLGQVSRPGVPISEQDLTGNVAHVFSAGRSVAAAPIGRDGKFRLVGLPAGFYDLVVVGDDGAAVLGFEAAGPVPLTNKSVSGDSRLVSFQEVAKELNVELAETPVGEQGQEEVPAPPADGVIMDSAFGTPFMGGGFPAPSFGGGFPGGSGIGGGGAGGGGFGGGGGGFGGGGIGGLLGIAGLAVGVAAISQDDDFNPGQATVIVP